MVQVVEQVTDRLRVPQSLAAEIVRKILTELFSLEALEELKKVQIAKFPAQVSSLRLTETPKVVPSQTVGNGNIIDLRNKNSG